MKVARPVQRAKRARRPLDEPLVVHQRNAAMDQPHHFLKSALFVKPTRPRFGVICIQPDAACWPLPGASHSVGETTPPNASTLQVRQHGHVREVQRLLARSEAGVLHRPRPHGRQPIRRDHGRAGTRNHDSRVHHAGDNATRRRLPGPVPRTEANREIVRRAAAEHGNEGCISRGRHCVRQSDALRQHHHKVGRARGGGTFSKGFPAMRPDVVPQHDTPRTQTIT